MDTTPFQIKFFKSNRAVLEEYGKSELKKLIEKYDIASWDNDTKEFMDAIRRSEDTVNKLIKELESMGYVYD